MSKEKKTTLPNLSKLSTEELKQRSWEIQEEAYQKSKLFRQEIYNRTSKKNETQN